jgi:hypothetical protein
MERAALPSRRHGVLACLGLLLMAVVVLRLMGRVWWCKCGSWALWTSDVISSHNSQHWLDPYSFSHFQHGLAFYWLLWLMLGDRLSVLWRGVVTVGLESLWEIFENTPFTIERYRAATISLDYYGDSVFNSLGDLASCAAGFAFAATVPVWGAVGTYLAVELIMLAAIRDSLLLNIVMLIQPSDAIRHWQQGG